MKAVSFVRHIDAAGGRAEHALFPFFFGGKPLSGAGVPQWGMTLLRAGSMRFRWDEKNEARGKLAALFAKKRITPIELVHSKIVVEAELPGDTENVRADGIISRNAGLVPTVTVADCVPIFLFDTATRSFGIFHSGWKGTGIAAEGVRLMGERFGAKPGNIAAAIGPHIGSCCYRVDEERAAFFAENFGAQCVKTRSGEKTLSLAKANVTVLKDAGIQEENIALATDCTCCATLKNGDFAFGSFRRQAAFLPPQTSLAERSRAMTVQAAFIG